ncbi:hypothetical protein N7462_005133 [Penicillium macrosclerotiorum]|uniref:uncharacterized protein n=1 Tax=Penicillium macrosclerotiorum TaxID=303699 RepID=UPI002549AE71|nr:uncharacterized protein N7462_005133 [Penicillium macrosclerotiorum]KAJ5690741.1 hypothetical protein N7462_005133 [Penicillium macrosclerotiorum]
MADETTSYSQAYLNESRQPMLISIAILFMAASTTIVILRFVSRRIGEVGLHREDIFILLGWAFYMAFIGVAIGDVKYGGVGLHQARVVAIDPHMMVNWAKFLLAIVFIYSLSVIWPKFAILSLYISLFSIHRVSRIICYATGILIATNAAANVAAGFAICRPLDALWTGDIAEHCFNINAFFRYSRIVNIISDVAMLILPIPHIVRLQSRTRLKIGLVITFLSGSL